MVHGAGPDQPHLGRVSLVSRVHTREGKREKGEVPILEAVILADLSIGGMVSKLLFQLN